MADNLTKLLVQIGADVSDLKKGMADAQKSTDTFGSTFKGVVAGIVASDLAGKVVDMSKKAIAGFGDLEQAVANISTIKPEINTSAVFASLNEMQTRVPQTAAQLGDSLYNIFSSIDVSQQDALSLLETFARGATGAATDAQTFGTSVLGVMNAYGLSVKDAEHISDVFFATVNKGVITGQELATSLGPVTQSAKAAGVSLDELGGFIAGVTKEGGPAAQNVNNLNNLFQKITTTDAQKEINNLGVATVDAQGKFRPMADILTDLKGKLGGMTQAAKLNALQTIFPDAQARQGAMTILSQLDMVKAAIKDNQTATGTAADAYKKMSATFNTQTALLSNTFQSMLTTIGANVLPTITPLITAFATTLPKAFHTAGDGAQWVIDHEAELKEVGAALAIGIASVVIPELLAMGAAGLTAAAGLAASAAAAALVAAPFVLMGAAVAGAAFAILKFQDRLIELIRLMEHIPFLKRWAQEAEQNFQDVAYSARFLNEQINAMNSAKGLQSVAAGFDAIKAGGAGLQGQVDYLNTAMGMFNKETQEAYTQSHDLTAAHQLSAEKAKALGDTIEISGAKMDAAREIAKKAGFEIVTLADGQTRFKLANEQTAVAAQEAAVAFQKTGEEARKAAVLAQPFGATLEDIRDKAAKGASALDLAWKAIDELTGHMTGAEQHNTTLEHGFDLAGKAAQAAFSAQTKDKIAEFARVSLDAATNAGLTGAPLAEMARLLPLVGQGGDIGEAALKKVKEILDKTAKPLQDENQLFSAQRQLAGDAAKEHLGLAGSMDSLAGSLDKLLLGLQNLLRELDPAAKAAREAFTKGLDAKNEAAGVGAANAQAWIAGIESKTGLAEGAAKRLAATGPANLNNRPLWLAAGQANAEAFAAGIESRYGLVAGTVRGLAAMGPVGIPTAPARGATPAAPSTAPASTPAPFDAPSWIPKIVGQAKQATEALDEVVKHAGEFRDVMTDLFSDTLVPSGGGFSQMAIDIASSAAPLDAMRGNLAANRQELTGVNARLLELHRQLLNTGPHDANREALQKEIQELQATKNELTSATSAYNALVKEIAEGATAVDGFTAQMAALNRSAENVARFGQTGAQSVDALVDAIMDGSPRAGAAAATLVNSMAEAARKAGVPNWQELAAAEAAAYAQAIADHSPESIQAALDATQALQDATVARVEAGKPTLQSAFADAFGADQIAAAVGSSWGGVFTQSAAAIDAGKELPIAALGRFRADAVAELAKLPQEMRDKLGPEAQAAWDAFVANPSADALARLQANAAQIHAAVGLIPSGFRDLLPDVQRYITSLVDMVNDGTLDVETATRQAGEAVKLIPNGFRDMLPETQRLIRGYVQAVNDGRVGVTDAVNQINHITDLIPKNLHELTPKVQADILAIVTAWQTGAISIEDANTRIAAAVKAGADATEAAAKAAAAAMAQLAAMQAGGPSAVTHTSTMQNGIQRSQTSNYGDVPGLNLSTVTEPGQQPQTTVTYNGQAFSFNGTPNEDQIMQALGFTNKASWEAWKKAQAAAHAPGGSMYGLEGIGQGFFGSNVGDPWSLLTALGLPAQPHAAGGVFTRPTTMIDTSGQRHTFAERGPELLAPLSSLARGSSMGGLGTGGGSFGNTPHLTVQFIVQGDVYDAPKLEQRIEAGALRAITRSMQRQN